MLSDQTPACMPHLACKVLLLMVVVRTQDQGHIAAYGFLLYRN